MVVVITALFLQQQAPRQKVSFVPSYHTHSNCPSSSLCNFCTSLLKPVSTQQDGQQRMLTWRTASLRCARQMCRALVCYTVSTWCTGTSSPATLGSRCRKMAATCTWSWLTWAPAALPDQVSPHHSVYMPALLHLLHLLFACNHLLEPFHLVTAPLGAITLASLTTLPYQVCVEACKWCTPTVVCCRH